VLCGKTKKPLLNRVHLVICGNRGVRYETLHILSVPLRFYVRGVNASGDTTYLVTLAQRKNMSSFKAGEIVTKNLSPCNATPTVAISDACREIR
jgi:hypothetical protein